MRRRWALVKADLGEPLGHEQGFLRPVLVISNEAFNRASGLLTVLPATSVKPGRSPQLFEVFLPAGAAGNPVDSISAPDRSDWRQGLRRKHTLSILRKGKGLTPKEPVTPSPGTSGSPLLDPSSLEETEEFRWTDDPDASKRKRSTSPLRTFLSTWSGGPPGKRSADRRTLVSGKSSTFSSFVPSGAPFVLSLTEQNTPWKAFVKQFRPSGQVAYP
ncbi:MAG: type II toxin-antitoxin system PemK/MazF family toxin [candidate division NC10 bacterium]|nr:type II toxin-antitoxin system PemK/MazF family toxin [candidate division NC10 bacterium]